ncbi:RNA-directed DNA polymerase, eukaryota [Tanacetum coccineum]
MGLPSSYNRRWDGDCVIIGDFNEVRTEQERYGSVFNVQGANAFNSFISLAGLIDLPFDGYAYTWAHETTNKMNGSSEEILYDRSLLLKELNAINSIDSLEATQKSKVRWPIEGDENTKFFHGLFLGIPIDSSLTLSYFFFADDAILVGKWDSLNIRIIVNVLKCFHLASGLKINFHKSKLMGIGTRLEEVDAVATTMGCLIFTTPFVHLGVKVGGAMYKIKYCDDVVAKVSSRLSKWKLKILSIGGRLTLIKSFLASIPLYHMSIFKVPTGVLNLLESIRKKINGVDESERKMSWISWNKVLATKKYGGLKVSSFYALNRALLFKWVRRFFLMVLVYGRDSQKLFMVKTVLLIPQVLCLNALLG